ncbi:MAG: hypothetical protein JWQ60_5016 [Pseudonocardia sp.]|nr:hypothetical protein [Pseudonocardia sp.]
MDGRTALQHAIMSVPVPGAPPRQFSAAAIGLSFLDSALRLNHVRRLTERLTITDHRVARRITEIDISLRMLDSGQRHAATLSRELRNAGPRRGGSRADRIWVPVARISRQSAAPVEVFDAAGSRLPRLTQYEASRLLASGLFRLLRGILDSLPSATPESDLHRFLHRAHESEWLVQHAIDILMTERHRPEAVLPRLTSEGVLEGQGARYRSLALAVLDKHEAVLADFFELFDIALDNDLLIVALEPTTDEHLLTYETALHVEPELQPGRRIARLLRSSADGYCLDYRSHISSSIPAYHLVVETEAGVDIARMYLSTDADARTADTLRTDLTVLAQRLENQRRDIERGTPSRASSKILELQMQTTLRILADLVRRRRWDAAQAGMAIPTQRMVACTSLALLAVSGEGTAGRQGEVDSSILRHPRLFPEHLRQAAEELYDEELYLDMALENDPTSSRAHANWRGSAQAAVTGTPVQIRAGMLLRDTTAAGPRRVCLYAVIVAIVGYVLAACLARLGWPFGAEARVTLGAIKDPDAVISVLLLVPGFLYTRLALSDRHSVAGHLRALPRAVANLCIGVVAAVGGVVAAGLPGGWVEVAFGTMVVVPLAGAVTLLLRRRTGRETAELVRLGAPRWLDAVDVPRVRGDARFFSALGRGR